MAGKPIRNLAAALLLVLLPSVAMAQAPEAVEPAQTQQAVAAAVEALQSKVKGEFEEAALALEDLKPKVDDAVDADAALAELKIEVDKVSAAVSAALSEINERHALVAKRLEELGKPADGQAEDPAVTADRERLQGEKAQITAIASDGEVIRTQALDLSGRIIDLRRTLFAETIFRHTDVNGELFDNAGNAAVETWRALRTTSSNSLEFMWRFKSGGLFLAIGATILFAILLAVVLQRFFSPLIRRDPDNLNPHYIHRLSVTFWSATIPAR